MSILRVALLVIALLVLFIALVLTISGMERCATRDEAYAAADALAQLLAMEGVVGIAPQVDERGCWYVAVYVEDERYVDEVEKRAEGVVRVPVKVFVSGPISPLGT